MAEWNPTFPTVNPKLTLPVNPPPIKVWGNEKTMNLNNVILTNIQSSLYYKTELSQLNCVEDVIDEIYYKVTHLEPWEKGSRKRSGQVGMCGSVRGVGAGGVVSSSFCLLFRLFNLRLTKCQLRLLLNHTDSPFIRGIGLLFIRYCISPQDLWTWLKPYLDDEEEIDPKAGGGHKMTIGKMVEQLLTRIEWYDTIFPRIPIPVQKKIDDDLKDHKRSKNQSDSDGGHSPRNKRKKERRKNSSRDSTERKSKKVEKKKKDRSPQHRRHRRDSPVYRD